MAVNLADVALRPREVIVALDQRAPHAEPAAEPAIARDASILRERAVNRLAEITNQSSSAPDVTRDGAGTSGGRR